jgi:hypothetical protein
MLLLVPLRSYSKRALGLLVGDLMSMVWNCKSWMGPGHIANQVLRCKWLRMFVQGSATLCASRTSLGHKSIFADPLIMNHGYIWTVLKPSANSERYLGEDGGMAVSG